MSIKAKPDTRYSIVVKNQPGELAKVTKLLLEANMSVSALQIATCGKKASIQFSRVWNRRGAEKAEKALVRGFAG